MSKKSTTNTASTPTASTHKVLVLVHNQASRRNLLTAFQLGLRTRFVNVSLPTIVSNRAGNPMTHYSVGQIEGVINKIQREDGSGFNFNVELFTGEDIEERDSMGRLVAIKAKTVTFFFRCDKTAVEGVVPADLHEVLQQNYRNACTQHAFMESEFIRVDEELKELRRQVSENYTPNELLEVVRQDASKWHNKWHDAEAQLEQLNGRHNNVKAEYKILLGQYERLDAMCKRQQAEIAASNQIIKDLGEDLVSQSQECDKFGKLIDGVQELFSAFLPVKSVMESVDAPPFMQPPMPIMATMPDCPAGCLPLVNISFADLPSFCHPGNGDCLAIAFQQGDIAGAWTVPSDLATKANFLNWLAAVTDTSEHCIEVAIVGKTPREYSRVVIQWGSVTCWQTGDEIPANIKQQFTESLLVSGEGGNPGHDDNYIPYPASVRPLENAMLRDDEILAVVMSDGDASCYIDGANFGLHGAYAMRDNPTTMREFGLFVTRRLYGNEDIKSALIVFARSHCYRFQAAEIHNVAVK
jgi:hypothetical protein